jgi:thymidylate synthase (FAD)
MPISFAQPFFRLFASHNERSGRYSKIEEYYTPESLPDQVESEFRSAETEALSLYNRLLDMGVAKEMARLVHLYRFYTKFYMTISLRHILEFLTLRNIGNRHAATAFWEVRDLLKQIVECWAPWAFEAYKQNSHDMDLSWTWNTRNLELNDYVKIGPSLCQEKVLDHGEIRLLETYGQEWLMLRCMEDFPNPLKGFGHGGMTFYLHIPIHVFRQWVRHRYGNWTELIVDFDHVVTNGYFFTPEIFRKQEGKPGHYIYSDMSLEESKIVKKLLVEHRLDCTHRYWRLREKHNLSEDISAMNLPYSFYIPVVWTAPVESLFNFFSLRCDSHAQYELRQYANTIWPMFKDRFPHSARLFAKYIHFGDSPLVRSHKDL